MVQDFDGKVVAITGGATGLGRAIALEVAQRGARAVIVNGLETDADDAQETAECVRAHCGEAIIVLADIGHDEGCRKVTAAAAAFGRLDALFNNAGTTKVAMNFADLDAVSAEDFLRIYRVNTVGAFQMVQAAQSLLEACEAPGAVVNTSSVAGVLGGGSSIPYAASKGALNTLTISLARALGPRIRVNAICPGFIDTPWVTRALDDEGAARMRHQVASSTLLQVASTAEDIAASAVFLASPASRHITGQILIVDAGLHLGPRLAAAR